MLPPSRRVRHASVVFVVWKTNCQKVNQLSRRQPLRRVMRRLTSVDNLMVQRDTNVVEKCHPCIATRREKGTVEFVQRHSLTMVKWMKC